MKRLLSLIIVLLALTAANAQPKREFRGAWIQCVNGQFQGMSTEKMQETLAYQLDELQKDGANAIIFQVRPECDALYPSNLEPWSRFLTGQQGKAPSPYWDPLQWMIEQCHARDMELHAWINPYRAKTKGTTAVAVSHVVYQHPERCFDYDGLKLLNPGIPENRDYICEVAKDIVTRYDIDGIHMDDYFYPYPVAGVPLPDEGLFRQNPAGFQNIGDWRRHNVNLFVKQFYETVHQAKPWVKVGISPFGIYRNKRSADIGSETNGLQNYDDLYADILLWVNNGWLDYCVPQVYWEIGNKAADYDTLVRWWAQYASARPLYIGEDIERTVKARHPQNAERHQQEAKQVLRDQLPAIKGTVLWYAKAAVDNVGNYGTMLRQQYWRNPALQPVMPFLDNKAPKKPRSVRPVWTNDGYILFWTAPKGTKWNDVATKYVVYRFENGEVMNTESTSHIVAITNQTFLKLPYVDGKHSYTYVITALDRMQNESKIVKKKIKL